MRLSQLLLFSIALTIDSALCDEYDYKRIGPWRTYKTRPEFKALYMDLRNTSDPEALAPGYFFLSPYVSEFQKGSFGPQIYDSSGNLIWYGNDTVQSRAMDAHVCDYLGGVGDHICFNDAVPVEQGGHSSGTIRFLDNTYTDVGIEYGEEGNLRAPDIHELNVPLHTDGQILLQDVYQPKSVDLSAFNGSQDGWALDACFQEVNLRTKDVNFEWCALDHVDLDETYLYLWAVQNQNNTLAVAGNGTSLEPWDFFHINSIAKNEENDYLISARHFNSLMKIAGSNNNLGKPPGEIIWRMGGKKSDFALTGFEMSRQHTARFLQTKQSETVISVFDNGSDGVQYTDEYSFGRILSLNNETMVVEQVHSYPSPEREHSSSQGSMQVLPGGNVVIGWGNEPFFTEFAENGTTLLHTKFLGGVESFRVWKYPWIGRPLTKPDVLPYSFNVTSSSLYAYVSWNGATEVASWRFHLSYNGIHGPWHSVGTYKKEGFETFVNFSQKSWWGPVTFAPFVMVEALDSKGEVLETSEPAKTFTPNSQIIDKCNETMCNVKNFNYSVEFSSASDYKSLNVAGWVSLAILMLTIESFGLFMALYGWDALVRAYENRRQPGNGPADRSHLKWSSLSPDPAYPADASPTGGQIRGAATGQKISRHKKTLSVTTGFSLNPLTLGNRLVKTYWGVRQAERHISPSSMTHRRNRSLALELGHAHSEMAPLHYDTILHVETQRKQAKSPLPETNEQETGLGGMSYVATSRD